MSNDHKDVKALAKAMSDGELQAAYDGACAFGSLYGYFGHAKAFPDTELGQILIERYDKIWNALTFGRGGKIAWYPAPHCTGEFVSELRLRGMRVPNPFEVPIAVETRKVLSIWTDKLSMYDLRLFWDYDIPMGPPEEKDIAKLTEIARIIGIREDVDAYYDGKEAD